MSRFVWRWRTAFFLVLAGTRAAHAQAERRLLLIVLDSVSGTPLADANVSVSGRARATTDTAGLALVRAAVDEQTLMIVRRLGFSTAMVRVPAGTPDDTVVVALAPVAIRLDASVTRATPTIRGLTLAGFYDRRRAGIGSFLDSATIAEHKPLDLLSLLRPYIKGCTMIFVDGIRMLGLRDVDVRQVVGIEIYHSNAEAPPQFVNPIESTQRCGSIVVWRR